MNKFYLKIMRSACLQCSRTEETQQRLERFPKEIIDISEIFDQSA